ncbi:MAG: hypothetical protein RIQ75_1348, partial [Pseudomonadota bacterium]
VRHLKVLEDQAFDVRGCPAQHKADWLGRGACDWRWKTKGVAS